MIVIDLFAWMMDPTAWAGLFTLVLLELVLGIDNLVFIAILAQRLPPKQCEMALRTGLMLALLMRVVLLAAISWLAALTMPLFSIMEHTFSGRDMVLLAGGLFLLWKATSEIHTRVEGKRQRNGKPFKARFWMVVAQIIVLDAVFSLDAVITAVGMTDHLPVMVIAVAIAIFIMMATSKPLTEFVSKHPTIVMLCLGFLLMVGFCLAAEGFGVDIPKGYLYAAIGFSVMIEMINQFARAKFKKRVRQATNMRQKTADAILKALGAKEADNPEESHEVGMLLQEAALENPLSPAEKELLRGVLNLSERPVHSIMTPRVDIEYINIRKSVDEVFEDVQNFDRSHLLVSDGEIDNVMGILKRDDFLIGALAGGDKLLSTRMLHEPFFVQKKTPVIALLEIFKKKPVEMAVVTNEFGGVEGVVTHLDVFEAIAGEFPDRDEPGEMDIVESSPGNYQIDGMTSIYDVINKLGINYEPDGRFATIAGLVLHDLGRFPSEGVTMEWQGYSLTVEKMDGRRIDKIRLVKQTEH